MSTHPNPRRFYRRFSDERIWREFMAACLTRHPPGVAAQQADEAYALYRTRFPVREPELEEEPDYSSPETLPRFPQ